MSIPMNTICIECYLKKRLALARELGTPEQATEFARRLMQQYLDADPQADSAMIGGLTDAMMNEFYGIEADRFADEKAFSNRFVLERLDNIRSRICKASDPVYAALQFAVLGNYIDFSALQGQVSFDDLDKMLYGAENLDLDKACYEDLCHDFENGKKLLYITDNAGEIAFDRLLAEEISKKYPHLSITFCVRGGPISNDATRADAQAVGIPFPVIDNGTAIGGTVISMIGQEAKKSLDEADVILAKGMGNTESMFGCGYNVYYAFLVKCERFREFFQKPHMTPMLIRDRV